MSVPSAIVGIIINLLFPAYSGEATQAISKVIITTPIALASFVAGILMQGAVIHAISEQYFNQPVNIGRPYSFAWPRTGDMFWAAVLAFLAIWGILAGGILISLIVSIIGRMHELSTALIFAAMIITAILAAIYLGITWVFMWQTAMLEGCGPTAALSRSSRLVRRSWWRVLGIILLLVIILMAINMILYIPAIIGAVTWAISATTTGAITGGTTGPPTSVLIWATVGALIGNIICIPIFTTGGTLLYFDLRVRKQGYNLDALAYELGLTSAPVDAASTPPV